jgi:RimJ/RimL family protein N-acetyltransferase
MRPIIKDQLSKNRNHICWSVREINKGDFIGLAGLVKSADRFKMAEIYFKLLPKFWGKGYATELANRIFQFGFEILDLHRIEAGVATENVKSIRVLEKLGMTREGIRRKILPIRGEWKDNFHYAILDEEF